MLTRNNRSLPHLDPKLDRLIRKKGRRKKNGAIPLIPLYLPAKSTMLIVDFFSISLPAAFLDFWVNLGGGKDLRMQKVKTTDTRKRTLGPDLCICFVWKMQKDWNTRKCPQTWPLYLFDIWCKKTERRMNSHLTPTIVWALDEVAFMLVLATVRFTCKTTFVISVWVFKLCRYFVFLCAIHLTNQMSNILTEF